jgi:hypothetical protein
MKLRSLVVSFFLLFLGSLCFSQEFSKLSIGMDISKVKSLIPEAVDSPDKWTIGLAKELLVIPSYSFNKNKYYVSIRFKDSLLDSIIFEQASDHSKTIDYFLLRKMSLSTGLLNGKTMAISTLTYDFVNSRGAFALESFPVLAFFENEYKIWKNCDLWYKSKTFSGGEYSIENKGTFFILHLGSEDFIMIKTGEEILSYYLLSNDGKWMIMFDYDAAKANGAVFFKEIEIDLDSDVIKNFSEIK